MDFNVTDTDVNKKIVDTVNKGEAHFAKSDLNSPAKNIVKADKLKVLAMPVKADIFLISVPTLITKDKKSDLSYVGMPQKRYKEPKFVRWMLLSNTTIYET